MRGGSSSRFSRLAALAVLVLAAGLGPAGAAERESSGAAAEMRLGRAVSPRLVSPGSTTPFLGALRERGIGRERTEAEFRTLKRPAIDRFRLGGREHVADRNLGVPPLDAGRGYAGPRQFFSVPYDAAIAVSPSQVLVMTNNQFAVYDRTSGVRQSLALFNDFFGHAAGGGYDPKCYWDAAAGRFVMVVLEWATDPNRAQVDLAVSQTSDANGAWYRYIYDATLTGDTPTGTWSDYPGLGHDDAHVYLTTNQFSFDGRFAFSKLRVWTKAELFAGSGARFVDFARIRNQDGSAAFSIKPARTLSPTSTGRLLATRADGGGSVSMWIVTGEFPALTLSAARTVMVGAYRVGPDARQPGTAIRVDTGDCRTQDVVWRDGHYHTAFTEKNGIGASAVTAVRYLDVTDAGAAVRDVTYFAKDTWLFYPAVSVDDAGNVAMVFGRSSPGEHASIYQTRMPAHGVFETSARLSAGVAPHTRLRWGDYNGVANDPIDPARIWVYGGYGITNDRWATWIASLEPSVPGGAPALLALEEEPAPGALRVRSGGAATFEIEFVVERSGGVRLEVFDVTGRRVRLLSDGFRETGVHRAEWDGRSDDGASLASGLYWLRLRSEAGTATERVTFLK